LKELGPAANGETIKLMKGRYGPYVTDGTTNATIPSGTDPLSVTLEQAQTLIAEREAKGGGKKKKVARLKAQPKTPAKAAKSRAAKPRKRASTAKAPEPVET
jgi:DNA topoisomerase-1